MKNKKRLIVFLICFLLAYLLKDKIYLYFESTNYVDSNSKTTIVTPVLDHIIIPDKNLIYCSTFQMAWNSLYKDVIKETIEIENKPWYVDKLNELLTLPPQISDDSFVVLSGLGDKYILENLKKNMVNKYGELPQIVNFDTFSQENLFIFAYFKKILHFKEKYGTFFHTIFFDNKNYSVKAFGFRGAKPDEYNNLKNQVKIFFFRGRGFIIELLSDSDHDNFIISNLKVKSTLLNTYNDLVSIINSVKTPVSSTYIKSLVIPKINFDINCTFDEMNNKKLVNKKFHDTYFSKILQRTLFKLDESGVRLESYVMFKYITSSGALDLVVDGPFVIFMKDKDAKYPYFMAYFGNDELLEK